MSYCRWSSDNWKCDVYVYEDVGGGWTTHVAGSRRAWPIIPDIPIYWLPRMGGEWSLPNRRMTYPSRYHKLAAWIVFGAWGWWHRLHMFSVAASPLKPITAEGSGEHFSHDTPGECADNLERLRKNGLHVPQYAIDALREENAEMDATAPTPTPPHTEGPATAPETAETRRGDAPPKTA